MTGLLNSSVLRGPLSAPQPFHSEYFSRPMCFQHIVPDLLAYFRTFGGCCSFRLIPTSKLNSSTPSLK